MPARHLRPANTDDNYTLAEKYPYLPQLSDELLARRPRTEADEHQISKAVYELGAVLRAHRAKVLGVEIEPADL